MLTHTTIGPIKGDYLVVYPTPGCSVLTVAGICRTAQQADDEAERLNLAQRSAERTMRIERDLCGVCFGGVDDR
jgi:hypothetical protein